ncbi:peptidase inhibitor family I36 protein [Kitasatospora sp. NPDC004531]
MYRRVVPALVAGLITTLLGFASPAAATTTDTAATSHAAAVKSYGRCPSGYFCIYSDWDGGGTQCAWSSSRVANTADMCSFIRNGYNVRSVANKTNHRVQYYTGTNYNNRVGSTGSGGSGNLMGSYQIRSFRPQ